MNLYKVLLTSSAAKLFAGRFGEELFLGSTSRWLRMLFIKLQNHLMHLAKHCVAQTKAIFNENTIFLHIFLLFSDWLFILHFLFFVS